MVTLVVYFSCLVIIVCLDNVRDLLMMLRMAHTKGMKSPDFVFFNFGVDTRANDYEPWIDLDEPNPKEVRQWQKILVEINYKQVCKYIISPLRIYMHRKHEVLKVVPTQTFDCNITLLTLLCTNYECSSIPIWILVENLNRLKKTA